MKLTQERIPDPEVRELAACAQLIRADYEQHGEDPWENSPFAWIKTRPSRQVGAIGEKLVAAWCAAKGFDVMKSPDSESDRIVDGHRIEIKFSTLWASGGYKFQQVRDQNYDYLFCLGISPFSAHAWLLPKSVLLDHVIGHMGQHTGATGTDTAWIGFPVGKEFEWMKPYGGSLAGVYAVMRSFLGPTQS